MRTTDRAAREAAADLPQTPSRTLDSHTVQKHHDYHPVRQIIIRKYHRGWLHIMIVG